MEIFYVRLRRRQREDERTGKDSYSWVEYSAAPAWTEYLVIVPEADGTSRVDDVLFASRRSDTLRARLAYFAAMR